MRKYMLLAKNDTNEEIFYTDIKREAKDAFDRMLDKYLFVKAYCYNACTDMYEDITGLNEESRWTVVIRDRKTRDVITRDFSSESSALVYIINQERSGWEAAKLFRNGVRIWTI